MMMQAGIVGMGIMGRLLALALHNTGWQVTLFDQDQVDSNCSSAAAGLLTPFSECDKADPVISQLGQESVSSYWPTILKQLVEPIYFQQAGCIVIHHPRDKAEWNHFCRRIHNKLSSADYFHHLSKEALIQLEPALDKFETAYYFPGEAQIDCQLVMISLKKYLQAQGISFYFNTHVTSLRPRQIVTDRKSYEFDCVFDCRGLGARAVFSDLRAVRGELIYLHAPDVQLQRPIRFLHPRYNLYIVPRPGNIYVIGASEIEAEDYSSMSVRTSLELLTAAYYVHSGFAEARIIETRTHCRPTLASHLPCLYHRKGLIAVNGLYRHGYLIAPALVKEVLCGINQHDLQYPELWKAYDHCISQ
jgi:glycine oxidase